LIERAQLAVPSLDPPRLVEHHTDFALGEWGDLFIPIWLRRTHLFAAQRAIAESARMIRQHPGGIAMLTVVGPDAGPPDRAATALLAAHMTSIAAHVVYSAVVFEGVGFRAAFVRAVTTGLSLLAKHPYPHRVCDLALAARDISVALNEVSKTPITSAQIQSVVQQLRQQADTARVGQVLPPP
jgi:hypothetical protein